MEARKPRTRCRSRIPIAVIALSVLGAAGAALGYDDFESYTNNQVLATATSNTVSGSRWGRFGAATVDVATAYTNQGVAGTVGARYPLNWALGNNGNLEFWFDAPLDLSAAPGVTVSLRIDTTVPSNTTVKAAFEEPDGTIWQSTTGQLLSNTNYVNFLFPFTSGAMTRSTGSGAFSLTAIKDLRLRFENVGGTGSQQVFADDFGAVTWTNVVVLTNSVLVTNQVFLTSRGMFDRNALWLTGGYASNVGSLSLVPALALQMGTKTDVDYWFVNMGSIGTNGFMVNGTPLGQVPNFLNTVKNWEDQHGKRFVLVAWLNAIITNAVGPSVTNPVTRANIVTECQRFVSTSVPGSHIVGANRTFDGVHFDFEPSGGDTNLANGLLPLMDQTRAGLISAGLTNGGHISFASQRFATGTSSTARWSPDLYYQMAQKVDSLGVMLYDTTINSASQFQGVVRDQTTNILHAISGTYWNDGLHPAPTNHPLMFMGFAAYLTTSDHNSAVENFTNAAFGADAAITDLINRQDPSVNYFGGAVVYRHTDGTGNDGSASYTNDWQRFQEKWIWGILDSPIPVVLPGISSVLQILSINVASNADVNLSWATLPGMTNVVQSTTGDASGNFTSNFTDISPPIIVPGSNIVTTNYVDVGAAVSASNHYYRVRVTY